MDTRDPILDGPRLQRLLDRVRDYTADAAFHTLPQIASACGGTEASCSARLRELRSQGYRVERQRVGRSGLWKYRVSLVPQAEPEQQFLQLRSA